MAGVDLFPVSKPPSLEGVASEARVELMVEWFGENFDDPAQETPYEGAEGGYIYVWGGPYDARDEIESAFPDATEDEIDAAVNEVESDGTYDWAPNGNRIREVEEEPDDLFGSDNGLEDEVPIEERLAQLANQLDKIEQYIHYWRGQSPGIGHNGAPGSFSISSDDEDLVLAEQSIAEVRAELAKADPIADADEEVVERAEGRFKKLIEKIKALAIACGAALGIGVIEGIGGAIGEGLYKDPQAFITVLSGAVNNLSEWAFHIPLSL